MKLIFVDTETTGLWPTKHALIQLSGSILADDKPPISFDYKIKPFPGDLIDATALKANGMSQEMIATYHTDPVEVFARFKSLLRTYVDPYNKQDKLHFIAYNANFDMDFLRAWFRKCHDQYFGSWFWFPPIDVMTLAGAWLMDARPTLENFKLATVCRAVGIEVEEEKLHDSMYDVQLTHQLYELIMNDLKLPSGLPTYEEEEV